MAENTERDNRTLIDFWDRAFAASPAEEEPEDWRTIAPSEKLFLAAASLGARRRVLDYGCGSAWAAIIAAKSGCPDVTAADPAPGAAKAAAGRAALYGVADRVHAACVSPDWLGTVPPETWDGFICSNVLDVVPEETAEEILARAARAVTPDAEVIVGLNFCMSPEMAEARGVTLVGGRRLYVDGVLRLVSRTDEEWAEVFSPWFRVEKLEHFAWPGEKTEARRLFRLRKREEALD